MVVSKALSYPKLRNLMRLEYRVTDSPLRYSFTQRETILCMILSKAIDEDRSVQPLSYIPVQVSNALPICFAPR